MAGSRVCVACASVFVRFCGVSSLLRAVGLCNANECMNASPVSIDVRYIRGLVRPAGVGSSGRAGARASSAAADGPELGDVAVGSATLMDAHADAIRFGYCAARSTPPRSPTTRYRPPLVDFAIVAMDTTGLDPVENGLSSLSQVRLALPTTLLGILALRLAARAFLAMMDKIQAQGWEGPAEEDEPLPPSSNPQARGNKAKAGAEGDEGEVEAVVAKAPGVIRKGLILAVIYLIGAAYFAEGAAHVIASLIKQEMTPNLPLFAHSIEYTAGGLAAFAALGAGLIWDERTIGLESYKAIYFKMFVIIGWALELAGLSYMASVLRMDPTLGSSTAPFPAVIVALAALRLLFYTGLLLALTPLLYRPAYTPIADASAAERVSLLNSNGTANNLDADADDADATAAPADYGATSAPIMPKNTLRASRPPSNRPPDPKSLSMFAFFTRIKVLFPFLWPSKSRSLQALAVVCVFLMLLKRVINVITPILFGRVIQDLVEGRPPYLNVGLYVLSSFLQDTNQMLYR